MSEAAGRVPGNRSMAVRLGVVVLAMFGFGYALVPLYDLMCQVTGLNGRTNAEAAVSGPLRVDAERTVTVEFLTSVGAGLAWEFQALDRRVSVHPGEMHEARFVATNVSTVPVVGQAVPNVAPNVAAPFLTKTECFCFSRQVLQPGESREMPVRFYVSPDLPSRIRTLTLSYTFFEAPEAAPTTTRAEQTAPRAPLG